MRPYLILLIIGAIGLSVLLVSSVIGLNNMIFILAIFILSGMLFSVIDSLTSSGSTLKSLGEWIDEWGLRILMVVSLFGVLAMLAIAIELLMTHPWAA